MLKDNLYKYSQKCGLSNRLQIFEKKYSKYVNNTLTSHLLEQNFLFSDRFE